MPIGQHKWQKKLSNKATELYSDFVLKYTLNIQVTKNLM